ncbi:LysE family transporter [Duodenibacillus massiliensis]|uniref:LysE family transporter n=1 Tax=Duodenibacillus massiliensis TaxID=1852381 RepID=UPI003077A0BA
MTWEVFGAFVVTSLILAVAPGPDNLFVLVQSAVYGARSGLAAVAGLVTGAALQTVAAAAGVAAVVAASDVLFWGIRILGALYLLYLAWGAWHAPHDAGIAREVA